MPFLWMMVFLIFFSGCSGFSQSEKEKWKKSGVEKQAVYRQSDQVLYPPSTVVKKVREPYPWEMNDQKQCKKTTKESPPCNGSSRAPVTTL